MSSIDLKSYLYMVESNPEELVGRFDEIYSQLDDAAAQNTLLLYKSMALVSLKEIAAATDLAESLITKAISANDQALLCRVYIVLSKCNSNLPLWQGHYLNLAHELAIEINDRDLIAEALIFKANVEFANGDSKKALMHNDMAIDLSRDSSDDYLKETVLINAATTYYRMEDFEKAIEYLCLVLAQNAKTKNWDRRLMYMCNLSVLYQNLKRFSDAEAILLEALSLANETRNATRKLVVLSKLGAGYLKVHDLDSSRKYFLECLSFSREIGFNNPEFGFELYNNIAGLYREMGQYDEVSEYLTKALECAEILDNDNYRLITMVNQARILSASGKTKESVLLIKKVITQSKRKKYYEILITAQTFLAELYEFHHKYDKSILTFKATLSSYQDYICDMHSSKIEEYNKKIAEFVKHYGEPDSSAQTEKPDSYRDRKMLIGSSQAIAKIREQIKQAAAHPNTSVIITGETGTGKEIVAYMIHEQSSRARFPIVAINTAAITYSLADSEFFGYVKGAFTGAYANSKGIFQRAQHGTVFLDEIAEMPMDLQAKLLRALETRKITPVGGNTELSFDCRIISSTNRDLSAMVSQNLFRLDLMHRLNSFSINIPPLRDRKEDIAILIDHYVSIIALDMNLEKPKINPAFYDGMTRYSFPGNVRELINIVERLMIMFSGEEWGSHQLETLGLSDIAAPAAIKGLKAKVVSEERKEIIEALQKAGGKQKIAAKILGISESTLTRRIDKLGLHSYTLRGRQK